MIWWPLVWLRPSSGAISYDLSNYGKPDVVGAARYEKTTCISLNFRTAAWLRLDEPSPVLVAWSNGEWQLTTAKIALAIDDGRGMFKWARLSDAGRLWKFKDMYGEFRKAAG